MTSLIRIYERKTHLLIDAHYEIAVLRDLGKSKLNGWYFKWTNEYRKNDLVCKIIRNNQVQGLIAFRHDPEQQCVFVSTAEVAPHNLGSGGIHIVGPALFAIAAKYSFDYGEQGCLVFFAKTRLVRHYIKSLGAFVIHRTSGKMGIDSVEADTLVKTYM